MLLVSPTINTVHTNSVGKAHPGQPAGPRCRPALPVLCPGLPWPRPAPVAGRRSCVGFPRLSAHRAESLLHLAPLPQRRICISLGLLPAREAVIPKASRGVQFFAVVNTALDIFVPETMYGFRIILQGEVPRRRIPPSKLPSPNCFPRRHKHH